MRFEVPSRFGLLNRLPVRYQSWDLSQAHLVDERTGHSLACIYPQDKTRNARALRRMKPKEQAPQQSPPPVDPIPPLLRSLLAEYAATGLPPAYIPKKDEEGSNG